MEFKAGTSLLSVCPYCSSAVARVGDDITELEVLGKVAPLQDLGSPLSVGTVGRYRGKSFTLVGRVQLDHGAGPWNEWYASFDNGVWGWVAEAQGKVYLTFRRDGPHALPSFSAVRVGQRVRVGDSELTVVERRSASFSQAEGELPFALAPSQSLHYCDLEGEDGLFGTLDYGASGGDVEEVFLGHQFLYADLFAKDVLKDAPAAEAAGAVGMNCPNCGAEIAVRAPDDALRVSCSACESLLDCQKGTPLSLLRSARRKGPSPLIPLGSTGKLEGERLTVFGFLTRSVTYDGIRYTWSEYLLHSPQVGYRWLVSSDRHWSFVRPISAGSVTAGPKNARYQDQSFALFSRGSPQVQSLRGEFYWKVSVGETVGSFDYVNPPLMLSREQGQAEVTWSLGRYVSPDTVARAFNLKKRLPRPIGVAPNQPNPHGSSLKAVLRIAGIASILILLVAAFFLVTADERTVYEKRVVLSSVGGSPKGPKKGLPEVSPIFELSSRSNLAISVRANVKNSWFYLGGQLINETLQQTTPFGISLQYYSGYSGGSAWSEGGKARTVYLGGLLPGRYSIRLDPEWQGAFPTAFSVVAKSDVFLGSHALVMLFLLWMGPILFALRYYAFEKRRWSQSDYG